MTTRRELLQALGAAAAGAVLRPRALRAATSTVALDGVGVQLYTLRSQMRENPEATLREIARLGYTEIEWWGSWGRTPAQLRAQLDELGLKTPAWHVPVEALGPDQLGRTIETAQAMGHKHLIVAWTAPAQRTEDGFMRLGELLSAAGRRGAGAGIRTGYHNHDFEFERIGTQTRWDILVGATDPAYVDLELDCYWAFKAGHDPIQMLRTHRDRITHLHLKDSAGAPAHRQMDLGQGVIDWRTLLRTALEGRVRHAFVEHDEPADAWATVSAGRAYLKTLGY